MPDVTAAFPDWVVPMAATLTQERFTGPEWIFERKFDGIRLLAFRRGADVRLFSRNRLLRDIRSLSIAIASLPGEDLILDGECTWGGTDAGYHVFDILWCDGREVMSLPLDTRRALLADLPFQSPLHRVTALDDRGTGRVHRVDRPRQAAALAVARSAGGPFGTRREAGTRVRRGR